MRKTVENLIGCIIVFLIGLAMFYVSSISDRLWLTGLSIILGIAMCISAVVCAVRGNR